MAMIIDSAAPGAADEAPDIAVLRPVGPLDFHTYAAFVEDARRVYESGSRCLRIDLTEVPAISMAGLVGLYEVAELFDGRPAPDFSRGWVDVHPALGPGDQDGGRPVEVIGLHGDAARALERAGLVTRFRLDSGSLRDERQQAYPSMCSAPDTQRVV